MAETCFTTAWFDTILKSFRIEQHSALISTAGQRMPPLLTHDQAIAQKHKSGRQSSRRQPRIEDETQLIQAHDLPAESPPMTPTSPTHRPAVISFSPPKKRKRRVTTSDEGLARSKRKSGEGSESMQQPSIERSPQEDKARNNTQVDSHLPTPDAECLSTSQLLDQGLDATTVHDLSMKSSFHDAAEDPEACGKVMPGSLIKRERSHHKPKDHIALAAGAVSSSIFPLSMSATQEQSQLADSMVCKESIKMDIVPPRYPNAFRETTRKESGEDKEGPTSDRKNRTM